MIHNNHNFPYIHTVISWAFQLLDAFAMPSCLGVTIAFILTLLCEIRVIFIDFVLTPSTHFCCCSSFYMAGLYYTRLR